MIIVTNHVRIVNGREYEKEMRFNGFEDLFKWMVEWWNSPSVQMCSFYEPNDSDVCHLFSFGLGKERVSVAMVRDEETNDIYYSDGSLTRGQKHLSDKLLPYIEKARKEMEKPVYRFI